MGDRKLSRWEKWLRLDEEKHSQLEECLRATLIGMAATAILLVVRQLGGLQFLELVTSDRMVQLRPKPGLDLARNLLRGINN